MTTNHKFPYDEQVGVLRLFVCREGNRGEKPETPGHGSREQSRVKRSQDFSHYEHWEALEGSRRSRSSKRHADTVLRRMPQALPAQGCNVCGANRRLSEYQLKKFPHLQKVIFREATRGRMIFNCSVLTSPSPAHAIAGDGLLGCRDLQPGCPSVAF